MILDPRGLRIEVMWIDLDEKFKGYHRNRTPCVITPLINKYENSTLYDILVNPEFQICKPNMMILKAVFEGKIKGAKVYSVPNRNSGKSILK